MPFKSLTGSNRHEISLLDLRRRSDDCGQRDGLRPAEPKTRRATAFFKDTLKAVKDSRAKKMLREDYLRGMARAGKPLEAYRAFPGGSESFRVLADQLVASGLSAGLRELVQAHEIFFDDDPYVGVYRGQLAYEARKYTDADAAWTAAFKAIRDESFVEQFQRRWVRARHGAGKILEAFNDIPQARDTFILLAELCLENRQHAELEKLLDAYLQREKYGFTTIAEYFFRMHGDADAATLLKMVEAKAPKDFRKTVNRDQLFSYLARNGKALEAYKAAPDPKQAFHRLCQVLLIYQYFKDMRQLIEMHRKADPTDPQIDIVQGELYFERHQFDKAIECLKNEAVKNSRAMTLILMKYVNAFYALGNGLKVYEDLGFDESVFYILARNYYTSRDAAGLEALLKARPAGGLMRKTLWEHQAHLKILHLKPDEALALFLAHREGKDDFPALKPKKGFGKPDQPDPADVRATSRKNEEATFMREMAKIGHGMDVYRVAAFPEFAFTRLAEYYRRENDRDGMTKLLAEHSGKHPKDPELATHTGFLELMRGNARTAEDIFRAELAKPDTPQKSAFNAIVASPRKRALAEGLARALIRQHKSVEQYRVTGSDAQAFRDLARFCVEEKASAELEALLAIHRKNHPKDTELPRYDGEAQFLRGDYDAAWNVFKRFPGPNDVSLRDKAIVCLVRLRRFDEAVNVAKDWQENSPSAFPISLVLAHAAAGDVKETLRLFEIHAKRYNILEMFYQDADLGPLLRSDAFRQVRERFPDPSKK
jgi:hypothetical protein